MAASGSLTPIPFPENRKVVLLSIPEGDDKVAKYPTIFRAADVVLLTKVDLLNVLNFNLDRVLSDISKLNSEVPVLQISAHDGAGMEKWLEWLKGQRHAAVGAKAKFVPV